MGYWLRNSGVIDFGLGGGAGRAGALTCIDVSASNTRTTDAPKAAKSRSLS
jgi:hypothetical protein